MNSLPFISHHLFVAAIGNEGRASARATRRERPSTGNIAPASAASLELMDGRKPSLSGAARLLRVSGAQARS